MATATIRPSAEIDRADKALSDEALIGCRAGDHRLGTTDVSARNFCSRVRGFRERIPRRDPRAMERAS